MQCIAMSHTICPKAIAIIVDGTGAIEHLIFTVAIHIAHAHLVIALSCIELVAGRIAVECPAMCKLAIAPVPGHSYETGIITAAEYKTWSCTIEISDRCNKTVHAIAVIIAPCGNRSSRR